MPAVGPRRGPRSGCSPAACRARSSPASTPPPRGCSPPRAATWSSPRGQGCCGALSVHDGREEEARALRPRAHRARFEEAGVRPSWSTPPAAGRRMKEYADLLRRRPGVGRAGRGASPARVRDVAEFLAELGPGRRAPPAGGERRLPRRLPPGARPGHPRQPRELLRGIPGLEVREIRRGGAVLRLGRHLQRAVPRAGPGARRPQGRNIGSTGAQLLVTANPGCLMQVASSLAAAGHRRSAWPTRSRYWTPRSGACRWTL